MKNNLKKPVGFIGLGVMGKPMAMNLLKELASEALAKRAEREQA